MSRIDFMAKKITRRRFYSTLCGLLAGGGAYSYAIEPGWVTTTQRTLPIANLPNDLVGKTLVQISDLHLGPVSMDYLVGCIEKVNALRPEIVCITGDFMTSHGNEQIPRVCDLMVRLQAPPLGTFATLGNHDYGPHYGDLAIADELARSLGEQGIRVLRNESVWVAGMQMIGMDELWAAQFFPAQALREYEPDRPALVLSHNPDTLDRPGWGDYRGWILSGHTHGGQCKPPFLTPPIVPVENKRYTAGAIDAGSGRTVYINRGLGFLRRIRFNARPEITEFTMQRSGPNIIRT